jgi:hypothetical protein
MRTVQIEDSVFLDVTPSMLESYVLEVPAACIFIVNNGSSRYLRNVSNTKYLHGPSLDINRHNLKSWLQEVYTSLQTLCHSNYIQTFNVVVNSLW